MGLVSCKLFKKVLDVVICFITRPYQNLDRPLYGKNLNVLYGAVEAWGRVEGETIEQTDVMASGGLPEIVY